MSEPQETQETPEAPQETPVLKETLYGQVVQFRCTPELEDMIRGDALADGTLSLSAIARLRLEIGYGLKGGPDHVTHGAQRSETKKPTETQSVPQAPPPEGPASSIRELGDGGRMTIQILEIVAHLSRQVLAASSMRVLELREGRLWPLVDSGANPELTDRLSTEGLPLDDGIAGQSVGKRSVWFGPVQESYKGTLEAAWETVGCAPIAVAKQGGGYDSAVFGLLFVGYEKPMIPTSAGRINLVAFATALARIWGLNG